MDATEDEGEVGDTGATNRAPDDLLITPAAILQGLPDAVVAAAQDGRIVFVNALAEELFGYPREELIGQPVDTLWPERVRERYTQNMELYFATEHPLRFSTSVRGLRRDGTEFIGEMSWGIVESTAGSLLLAVGRDISERYAAEARLRAVAALGEWALAGADPVDLAGEAIEQLRSLLPVGGAEVRLADGSTLASRGITAGPGVRLAIGTTGPQADRQLEPARSLGGEPVRDAGDDELIVATERDLSAEELSFVRAVAITLGTALKRLRDEERTRHEAVHDPLTGLANRTLLRDRLEHALARSGRERGATAVLFIDLDNFKQVNDTHGHAAGDTVLVETARRLLTAVRPGDTVARLGGDEFVAVCEHIDEESAVAVGRRLQQALAPPLVAGGVEHRLSASIGIAIGDDDPGALLDHADAASYRAKAAGRGRIEVSAGEDPAGPQDPQ